MNEEDKKRTIKGYSSNSELVSSISLLTSSVRHLHLYSPMTSHHFHYLLYYIPSINPLGLLLSPNLRSHQTIPLINSSTSLLMSVHSLTLPPVSVKWSLLECIIFTLYSDIPEVRPLVLLFSFFFYTK